MTETPQVKSSGEARQDPQDSGFEDQSEIKRFTTIFDAEEDRLKVAVELEDGSTRLLWMTRRLLLRIVPQLVALLERNERQKALQQSAPVAAENLHRQNQMAALGRISPQKTIVAPEPEHGILISGLTLRQTPKGLLFIFFDRHKTPHLTVPFDAVLLRQWLSVLHRNFAAAGWTDDVWPEWMSFKSGKDLPGAVRLN
jgi:hypothetical protein